MTYNLHPLFVHFPIALLFIYSIIKILPFQKWFPKVFWKDIERVLLLIGVLGAFVALSTGEIAEELVRANHSLVEMHSAFASVATWLYSALLIGEIATIINARNFTYSKTLQFISSLLKFIEKILNNQTFVKILAVLALIAISVTGLLGGVIVYGPSADPFANIVLKILNIQL